jgi:hypothetical protein
MKLTYIIIGFSALFFIFFFNRIRSFFKEWNNLNNIKREARFKKEKELALISRNKELARIERQNAVKIKERNESLKKVKDEEVKINNSKYKSIFTNKYENARIYHEVQYTGAYRLPISDYDNYDLKIHGISFFIDNIKSEKGKGKIEVRHNSFEDHEFDTYNLEIIDGFAILNEPLKNKNNTPRKDYTSTHRQVYLIIRENSFKDINTGIIHKIIYTPFSILDWK